MHRSEIFLLMSSLELPLVATEYEEIDEIM